MITVMGATGNTGRPTAERLLAAGEKVRVLGRSADRLKTLVTRGAEARAGAVEDAGYLTEAFRGADAVYAMVPPDYASPDFLAVYDRVGEAIATGLRRSGVRRVVFLSSTGAHLPSGTGPIVGLHRQEERLKALGLNLLILRPGYFYENLYGSLPVIRQHGINGGAIEPEVAIHMVATQDIGAAAAEGLRARDEAGVQIRELLGPRDYSLAEATAIIGRAIGKPDLKYVRLPDEDFVKALIGAGFSERNARLFVEMSRAISEGKCRTLEGRNARNTTPTTLEAWVPALAAAYKAG